MEIEKKLNRASRPLHRWLTILIGLQILVWTLSGLVMSFFPIEKVRSEHHFVTPTSRPIFVQDYKQQAETAQKVLARLIGTPTSITFNHLLDRPIMKVDFADGSMKLVATDNGEILNPLNQTWASNVAKAHYQDEITIRSATYLNETNREYRKDVPVWRVDFENDENTTYYISPETGYVLARRSDLWRFYDFFWMLHIMDYWNRTNFNSWWLVTAAMLGVLATTSGLILGATYLKRKFT